MSNLTVSWHRYCARGTDNAASQVAEEHALPIATGRFWHCAHCGIRDTFANCTLWVIPRWSGTWVRHGIRSKTSTALRALRRRPHAPGRLPGLRPAGGCGQCSRRKEHGIPALGEYSRYGRRDRCGSLGSW